MKKSLLILSTIGVIALVCCICVFTAQKTASTKAVEQENAIDDPMFHDWKHHNRKFYFSVQEHNYRYGVFNRNKEDIIAHNANQDKTFTKGVNRFSDLTDAEFIRLYTGAVLPEHSMLEEIPTITYDTSLNASEIDWTTRGAVTPVKNQGQCGSCWSFSATGTLEGAYYLKKGSLKSFSEQQLVDCTRSLGNQGCHGGWPYLAFSYWRQTASELESDYSYEAIDDVCRSSSSRGVTYTSSYSKVRASADQLAGALNSQPVSICVDATPLKSYQGGIVMSSDCSEQINHAVLAVGYDVNEGYFKVKNSWGAGWGEQGYFKIQKGPNTCGMLDYAYVAGV